MNRLIKLLWNRIARCFFAGLLAILPIVITVAIVIWVADFVKAFLGPDTTIGRFLVDVGGNTLRESTVPYLAGWIVVLGVVFLLGVFVEFGAKTFLSRLADSLFQRIPLIGNIYSTAKQVVEMLDKKDDDALQGMSAVLCFFGKEASTGVLAFLVSPETFRLHGQDYHIVMIPTAPLPFGGAMLFVPISQVKPADMPIDGLMSIYLSMGVSAPQYLGGKDQQK